MGRGRKSETGCGSFEGLIRFGEILGDDADFAGDGHEVGVALPAGNNVKMEMSWQSGAGTAAQIEADVEALRIDGFGEGLLGSGDHLHQLEHFSVGEFLEVGFVGGGGNEEVAVGVGEAIQAGESEIGTPENEVFWVICRVLGVTTEEAVLGIIQIVDVFHAPRGPEVFRSHGIDFRENVRTALAG